MAIDTQTGQSVADAAGNARVTFATKRGQSWVVSQFTVSAGTGATSAECGIYLNEDFICPVVPTGDAAGGAPSVPVNNGSKISARWTGCAAGTVVKGTIIYDDGNTS